MYLHLRCRRCEQPFGVEPEGLTDRATPLGCPSCKEAAGAEATRELAQLLTAFQAGLQGLGASFQVMRLDVDGPLEGDGTGEARAARVARAWAQACEAARFGLTVQAFTHLKEVLGAQPDHPEALALLAQVHCPACKERPSPPPSGDAAAYALFWRGRCPACEGPLEFPDALPPAQAAVP